MQVKPTHLHPFYRSKNTRQDSPAFVQAHEGDGTVKYRHLQRIQLAWQGLKVRTPKW